MWEGAEPNSGLAPERIHLDEAVTLPSTITTGGSGFGIAGLIAAMDRKIISREDGVARLRKMVDFLAKADRFHGVWSHWIDGETGKVIPFSPKDDGGDLVESSFLMSGLLIARQYLKDGNETEKALASDIDKLWREMEFDWYLNGGQDVLFWHWSPNCAWEMNMPIEGYNEALIAYVLAASSPTHSIPASAYHKGWARSGGIKSDKKAYGLPLVLKHNGAEEYGGPLFWAHYSWIGLDPRKLQDQYANYWEMLRNHALINYTYCKENPKGYEGYGENCWGLTASYSPHGYAAHAPNNDLGVIAPTAALSSFPYTPEQSMKAARHFYSMKKWIWGKYGFYDAFSEAEKWKARPKLAELGGISINSINNWTVKRYLAIDQLTITPMIENYRTGLLWDLFMSCPEIQQGLTKLGFTY